MRVEAQALLYVILEVSHEVPDSQVLLDPVWVIVLLQTLRKPRLDCLMKGVGLKNFDSHLIGPVWVVGGVILICDIVFDALTNDFPAKLCTLDIEVVAMCGQNRADYLEQVKILLLLRVRTSANFVQNPQNVPFLLHLSLSVGLE